MQIVFMHEMQLLACGSQPCKMSVPCMDHQNAEAYSVPCLVVLMHVGVTLILVQLPTVF